MKKLLTVLFASAVIYSCGEGGEQTDNRTSDSVPSTTDQPATGGTPEVANLRGLELIGASDCTTCHAIDKKVIGPSYVDVAKKYENTPAVIDTLVSKVKKGGMGVWGNIPMTPHPDLPDEDAREMVKYILSLKDQQ